MSITESRKALEDFAKDPLDECFDRLEPWAGAGSYDYYPSAGTLGGQISGNGRFSFPFESMTPDEYNQYAGANIPSDLNPAEYGGWSSWLFDYEVLNGRWGSDINRYVDAINDTGGATSLNYGPPGDAPWTDEIRTDWISAVDNRCDEVDVVRGELTFLMENIVQAAEEYADTDLSNAVTLSKYGIEED